MRRIAIVGSGQSGLILGLGLLAEGYKVTLYTDRDQDQLRQGNVLSSQCLFSSSLAIERSISSLTYADKNWVEGIGLKIINLATGKSEIQWRGTLKAPGQAVDQRMKLADLMDEFIDRGGILKLAAVTVSSLDVLANEYELVIVASGNSPLAKAFEKNQDFSPFDQPQRRLALCYVNEMQGRPQNEEVSCHIVPGVGEYFVIPAITFSGPCHVAFIEAIPGGEFDCFQAERDPESFLAAMKKVLKKYIPEEYEKIKSAVLTDDKAILSGAVLPIVRHPVLKLPSGKSVLAIGDAAVTNDPISGQGANSAIKASKIYLDAIISRGDLCFDDNWMNSVFNQYWEYAKDVCAWTNSLLIPPTANIMKILIEAQTLQSTADNVAAGFNHPPSLFPWWANPNEVTSLERI